MRTSIPTQTPTRSRHEAPTLRMPDWGAAGWAGLIAGTVAMLSELVLLPLVHGGNAWVPVRMVAAIVFGPEALPASPLFSAPAEPGSGVFLMALALHFSLSLIYLRVLSTLIYRLDRRSALMAGAVFGLGLYLLNFHVLTAAFPWFVEARGWVSAASNVIFGLTAAAAYKAFERTEPLIEEPLEQRRTKLRRH